MSDVQTFAGGGTKSPPYVTSPIAGSNFPVGTPLTLNSSGQAVPAQANALGTATVIGLAITPGVTGQSVDAQWGGSFALTAAQWSSILGGSGAGLVAGKPYYLSNTNAGQITDVQPDAGFSTQLGVAEASDPDTAAVEYGIFISLGAPFAV